MTPRSDAVAKAHRLLAPRIAYLIGSRSPDGEPNLIPVSNLTSVSTEPQLILLAVLKRWRTFENLSRATGFTVSVPTIEQLDGVWRLGARYSRYPSDDRRAKLRSSGLRVVDDPAFPGPVLDDGIGWLVYTIVARPDVGGDHGVFVGQVDRVRFNPDHLNVDGTPIGELRPVMQVTGNRFTTAGHLSTVPYGPL